MGLRKGTDFNDQGLQQQVQHELRRSDEGDDVWECVRYVAEMVIRMVSQNIKLKEQRILFNNDDNDTDEPTGQKPMEGSAKHERLSGPTQPEFADSG